MCGRMDHRDAFELQKLVVEAYQNWTESPDIHNLQLWHDVAQNLERALGHEIQILKAG